jgi:hypothetical protein
VVIPSFFPPQSLYYIPSFPSFLLSSFLPSILYQLIIYFLQPIASFFTHFVKAILLTKGRQKLTGQIPWPQNAQCGVTNECRLGEKGTENRG